MGTLPFQVRGRNANRTRRDETPLGLQSCSTSED